jgi:hypothetical protein
MVCKYYAINIKLKVPLLDNYGLIRLQNIAGVAIVAKTNAALSFSLKQDGKGNAEPC